MITNIISTWGILNPAVVFVARDPVEELFLRLLSFRFWTTCKQPRLLLPIWLGGDFTSVWTWTGALLKLFPKLTKLPLSILEFSWLTTSCGVIMWNPGGSWIIIGCFCCCNKPVRRGIDWVLWLAWKSLLLLDVYNTPTVTFSGEASWLDKMILGDCWTSKLKLGVAFEATLNNPSMTNSFFKSWVAFPIWTDKSWKGELFTARESLRGCWATRRDINCSDVWKSIGLSSTRFPLAGRSRGRFIRASPTFNRVKLSMLGWFASQTFSCRAFKIQPQL